MKDSKILPDDPQLTAYALGELEGEECAAVEAALKDNAEAQAAVEQIRALAGQLEGALAGEPLPKVELPAVGADPYAVRQKKKIIRFPQVYFMVAGLAAACFAVMVALHEPEPRVMPEPKGGQKIYTEMVALPPVQTEPKDSAQAVVAATTPAPAVSHSYSDNSGNRVVLDSDRQLTKKAAMRIVGGWENQSSKVEATPGGSSGNITASDASTGSLALDSDVAKLETFAVTEERDTGYLRTNSVTAIRINPPVVSALRGMTSSGMGSNGPMPGSAAVSLGSTLADESYAYRADNGFLSAKDNPLSTFSMASDTASYANLRRLLNAGQKPPADAVRIEEMLNYFGYHYPAPKGDDVFAASLEVADAPWAEGHRLVRVGLKGREVTTAQRGAANLVFLLDVSGSMNAPNRLPLVKESLRLLVNKLRPDDRVAIITYAGHSGMALASTPVKRASEIMASLDELEATGSTNGAMGIQLAYDVAKANFVSDGINRVILCTDGDFNVGVTNQSDLTKLIQEKAKSGVFLTVLGFGMGNLKDSTLELLASKGNGNYGYIDTRTEAEKLFVQQVNGTLVTIAKDVKIQVEFNPAQVSSYRLIGYESRLLNKEDFNNDKIDAGEIGAGHTVTALYEVIPAGMDDAVGGPKVDPLKYQQPDKTKSESWNRGSSELLTVKLRYKEPQGEVSKKLEFPLVDRGEHFSEASEDFKFAAAVAGFGMLLRDSPHKGNITLAEITRWAHAGMQTESGDYRSDFLKLLERAEAVIE